MDIQQMLFKQLSVDSIVVWKFIDRTSRVLSIKMKKRSENDEASGSQASEKPKVFTALHRDPKYRKANAEFLTRRLRLEFDKLTTARPLCKGVSSIPPLPPELQKCRKINFRSNAKKSRKRSNFSQNICIYDELPYGESIVWFCCCCVFHFLFFFTNTCVVLDLLILNVC